MLRWLAPREAWSKFRYPQRFSWNGPWARFAYGYSGGGWASASLCSGMVPLLLSDLLLAWSGPVGLARAHFPGMGHGRGSPMVTPAGAGHLRRCAQRVPLFAFGPFARLVWPGWPGQCPFSWNGPWARFAYGYSGGHLKISFRVLTGVALTSAPWCLEPICFRVFTSVALTSALWCLVPTCFRVLPHIIARLLLAL